MLSIKKLDLRKIPIAHKKSPELYPDFFTNSLILPEMAAFAYPACTAVSAIV